MASFTPKRFSTLRMASSNTRESAPISRKDMRGSSFSGGAWSSKATTARSSVRMRSLRDTTGAAAEVWVIIVGLWAGEGSAESSKYLWRSKG